MILFIVYLLFVILFKVGFSIPYLSSNGVNKMDFNSCLNGVCQTENCVHVSSSMLSRMDQNIEPCDDFFKYACGKWIGENSHELDKENVLYSTNANEMPKKIDDLLKDLITEKRKINDEFYQSKSFSNLHNFYESCMDTKTVISKGMKPALDTLRSLKNFFVGRPFDSKKWNLSKAIVEMSKLNGSPLLGLSLDVDLHNSSRWIPVITYPSHSGLSEAELTSDVFLKSLIKNKKLLRSKFRSKKQNSQNMNIRKGINILQTLIQGLKRGEFTKEASNIARSIRKICERQSSHFGQPNKDTSFFQRFFEKSISHAFTNNQNDKSVSKNGQTATQANKSQLHQNEFHDVKFQDGFSDMKNDESNIADNQDGAVFQETTINAKYNHKLTINSSYRPPNKSVSGAAMNSEIKKQFSTQNSDKIPTVEIQSDSADQLNSAENNQEEESNSPSKEEFSELVNQLFQEVNNIFESSTTSANFSMQQSSLVLINEALNSGQTMKEVLEILDVTPNVDGLLVFQSLMNEVNELEIEDIKKLLSIDEVANILFHNVKKPLPSKRSPVQKRKILKKRRGKMKYKILSFLKELRKNELTEREKLVRKHSEAIFKTKTIKELQQMYPFVQWHYILTSLINADLNEDQSIMIIHEEYFEKLNNFLKGKQPWLVHHAMLALYLQDVLFELVTVDSKTDRNEFCLKVTKDAMQEPLTYMYFQHIGEDFRHIKNEVRPLIDSIKKSGKSILTNLPFLTTKDKVYIRRKIDAMSWEIGGYVGYRNFTYVEEIQRKLTMSKNDFYSNVMSLYRDKYDKRRDIYNYPVDPSKHIWIFSAKSYVVNAFYVPNTNTIILPQAFFYPPYFYRGAPSYIHFAGVGIAFAHELMHAFDSTGLYFDEFGVANFPFSKAMQRGLNEHVKCYNNLLESKFNMVENIEGMNVNITIDTTVSQSENLADLLGLEIAFNAYREFSKNGDNHEENILPGQPHSQEQLFFIAFAQPYCAVISKEAKLLMNYLDEHLMNDVRVNALTTKFSSFVKSFSCMNE